MQLWMVCGTLWTGAKEREAVATKAEEKCWNEWRPQPLKRRSEAQDGRTDKRRKRQAEADTEQELKKRRTDTRVYMDDRSVVSGVARGMPDNVSHWHEWSRLAELHEND